MFGLPSPVLGHLTSSGTIANLEALWVARELHPGKASCTPPTRTTRTGACARCSASRLVRSRPCPTAGSTSTRSRRRCARGERRHRRPHGRHDRARRGRPDPRGARAGASATACASTSTPRTAASSRCSAGTGRSPRRLRARSAAATRSWSTRTSTGCSPTAAARCSSPTRPSGGSTRTTRRTRTSRPTSCTWARSASSARAPAPRRRALWLTLQVLPLEADDGLGPILAAARRAARALRRPARSRPGLDAPPRARARHRHLLPPRAGSLSEVDAAPARMLRAGMNDPDDPVFLSHAARRRRARSPRCIPSHAARQPTASACCAASS